MNLVIKANSDNEVKPTHEDDLKTEIYNKEEASIENRSSSDYDILKEIEDGQYPITLMERISARQQMEFREGPIRSSLKDPDTLSIIVHRHKQNNQEDLVKKKEFLSKLSTRNL